MPVTTADIDREKKELPTGWGRFGKALDQLTELAEPDESLLATCVTLNPDYHHGVAANPFLDAVNTVQEMREATNVVVACTDRRVLIVFTGMGGAPRGNVVLPFDGTSIAERGKKEFTLDHNGTRIRFRGAAKKPAARLLDALAPRLPLG